MKVIKNNVVNSKQNKKNISRWISYSLVVIILFISSGCELFKSEEGNQEFVIGRRSDSKSLDPATATDFETFQVTSNIFETLVTADTNGIDILPGLAESWEVSEDGLTFVFKLQKEVKFQDNTPFDAAAVVFNFKRWMDNESPYHIGQFTYWNQSFGGEPGMIKSITALSSDLVEIILNEPYTPFLSVISMPSFGIASPTAIMTYNENLVLHPVGTGPYKFLSWAEDGEIVLTRFEDYKGDQGNISKIIFRTFSEEDNYVELLKNGDIHLMNQVTEDDIVKLEQSDVVSVDYMPFLNISYLALNHLKKPFDQLKVRQAIAKVINQEEMVEAAYDILSRPSYSFLPPTLDGHDESFKSVTYDVEGAKELLRNAGYPNGFDTNIYVMNQPRTYYPNPELVADYLSQQLSLIGIRAEVVSVDWKEYSEVIGSGEHDMALVGWQGDFADPDNFLYTMFYSSNTEEGTVLNYSFYSNTEVDNSLRKARRVADKDFRAFIYREIQEQLYKDIASIPLAHTMTAIAINKSINGFEPNISGLINVKTMEVINDSYD